MDEYPRMLYRVAPPGPGAEPAHGGHFATLTVDDFDALAAAINDGWHVTTPEAVDADARAKADADAHVLAEISDDNAPPSRSELQQQADKMGIKVDGRWSDRKLRDVIAAALKA